MRFLLLVIISLFSAQIYAENLVGYRVNAVSYFVSRTDEIERLQEALNFYRKVSLVGMTNIGKTEITRKYSDMKQDQYKLIWFFDSSLDLNEQFVSLAKKINEILILEKEHTLSEDANHSKKEVIDFLTPRNDWLLVFDNLRVNNNDKLKDIIDWQHAGHIIICSQDAKHLPNVIYVHQLDERDSLTLLQNIVGKDWDEELLKNLIQIFKGYPGSIVQGAWLMKEHDYLSLNEYKNILISSEDPALAHVKLVLSILTPEDNDLLKQIALINTQRFSKNFLKSISNRPNEVGESLYNLNRFGLIKHVLHTKDSSIFEMHDVIKTAILSLNGSELNSRIVSNIIDKIKEVIPMSGTNRYLFINGESTLKENLESILVNAEHYDVKLDKILELRKNLLDYYLGTLDYYNCEKMQNWLIDKEQENSIAIEDMDDSQRINYSWYNLDMGIYEDFAKSNFIKALAYYQKARDLAVNIQGQPELDFAIFAQIAQTYIYIANIIESEKNIIELEKIITQSSELNVDKGLYWFLKSKVALSKGDYEAALDFITTNIKEESHLPQDTFTAPPHVLKSEILNFMGEYEGSYKVIKRIYDQEIGNKKPEHEFHARILTQLANAELGLGKVDLALAHANEACTILKDQSDKYNIETEINNDLASAFVSKADALVKQNKFLDALKYYNKAEKIFLNRYSSNFGGSDEVAYMLMQGAKAAIKSNNNFWIEHFKAQFLRHFGKTHFRAHELESNT